MKRSDMVKLISDVYYDSTVNCDCPEKYSVLAAESILEVIEEAGMLPPFNTHDFYMDGDHADNKSITYRTWEPELEVTSENIGEMLLKGVEQAVEHAKQNAPCEPCAKNNKPNCGNEHCYTNREDNE